jgi:hypothetical protein
MKKIALVFFAALFPVAINLHAQPVSTEAGTSGSVPEQRSNPAQNASPNQSATAPLNGGSTQGSEVRGDPRSGSTSDREASRTWSGIGSTGGGTGTGTSSGMAQEPPPSGAQTDKNKADTEPSQK